MDLEMERRHLAKAERDVAEGEQRVQEQTHFIDRLRRDGHDTRTAEALLATLTRTLQAWRDHRDQIRRTVERLEAEAG